MENFIEEVIEILRSMLNSSDINIVLNTEKREA